MSDAVRPRIPVLLLHGTTDIRIRRDHGLADRSRYGPQRCLFGVSLFPAMTGLLVVEVKHRDPSVCRLFDWTLVVEPGGRGFSGVVSPVGALRVTLVISLVTSTVTPKMMLKFFGVLTAFVGRNWPFVIHALVNTLVKPVGCVAVQAVPR